MRSPYQVKFLRAYKLAETVYDLSLAYSPGVAEPVQAIADDPEQAAHSYR